MWISFVNDKKVRSIFLYLVEYLEIYKITMDMILQFNYKLTIEGFELLLDVYSL